MSAKKRNSVEIVTNRENVDDYSNGLDKYKDIKMIKNKYKTSIYIFHRALRLDDNKGLICALKNSEKVLPIFIFTPEQITDKNKYRSEASIRFMIDSLNDLNDLLKKRANSKIHFFYGEQDKVLNSLLHNYSKKHNIDAVFINADYTPYALRRENKIAKVCSNNNVDFISLEDYLLYPVNSIQTNNNSFYSVYTPFYKKAYKQKVDKPVKNMRKNYVSKTISINNKYSIKDLTDVLKKAKIKKTMSDVRLDNFPGSRAEGLKRVLDIKNQKNYKDKRNDLTFNTTRLSAYIKFGIVSPREVYYKIFDLFGVKHTLIAQLIWRDFYYNIAYNRPDVLKGKSFKESYDKIIWGNKTNTTLLKKWELGMTGVPIVDAGMRELVESNFMHNRSRLITSNYLVKHYFIDWREGEKFYAKNLVDYDPAVNNGNWQWSSGSGADAQPYFRMMNPWLQMKKFDPECKYVKKWIPELKDVPTEDIFDWENTHQNYKYTKYPGPFKQYNFKELKKESKKYYSSALKK